jgi:hypothetical protein
MQWYNNATHEIGVYEPNYAVDHSQHHGQLIEWNANRLRWFTADGEKPGDHSKDCSVLSSFATSLKIECEHAISVVFAIGLAILVLILLCIFFFVRRR